MKSQITFSELLLLTRVYRANPTLQNERTLNQLLKGYWAQLPAEASPKLFRLRLFLLHQQQAFIPRRKFKAFAAREWLIQFSRASSPLCGLDSRRCCSGSFNSAVASTAQLTLVGS